MNTQTTSIVSQSFIERLRTAGIEPGDSEEVRLSKSLLMLATGLVCAAMMVWLALYSLVGLNFSTDIPMIFLLMLAGNMYLFIRTHRYDFFRVTQLGLFLFLPYGAQWATGNLIVSSGIVLWGLLAPIGAILCIGARESMGWFIAWVVLTALSGGVDYYMADALILQQSVVPVRASLLFFTLNFICVAAISYSLLLYSIEQKRKIQERMELARQQLKIANDAAENLIRGPVIFI